jgi:hypothetical protein
MIFWDGGFEGFGGDGWGVAFQFGEKDACEDQGGTE